MSHPGRTKADCEHCRNGYLDGRYGIDVECVNGVLIDIDRAHEGWARDTIYPPAPCIRHQWLDDENDGDEKAEWFEECQRRLDEWSVTPAEHNDERTND